MPTYVCRSHPGALTAENRAALARCFTTVHSRATGAPPSFVQVFFDEVPDDAHFIGGRPADGIHVHGHIRDGRSAGTRQALAEGLRDDVVAVTGIAAELVWVYLSEIPASQMIEFGRVLPAPGAEAEWKDGLPPDLRERLDDLDTR